MNLTNFPIAGSSNYKNIILLCKYRAHRLLLTHPGSFSSSCSCCFCHAWSRPHWLPKGECSLITPPSKASQCAFLLRIQLACCTGGVSDLLYFFTQILFQVKLSSLQPLLPRRLLCIARLYYLTTVGGPKDRQTDILSQEAGKGMPRGCTESAFGTAA